jgi:hypothetical protein
MVRLHVTSFIGNDCDYRYNLYFFFFLKLYFKLIPNAVLLTFYFSLIIIFYRYVPKRFLPKMFDYRRDVPEEMKNDGDLELGNEDLPTCAICFMTVDTMTEQYQDRTYMLTPCNHLYHAECLTTWFVSGHLNCPVCRSSCPPEGRRDVLDGEMVVPAG